VSTEKARRDNAVAGILFVYKKRTVEGDGPHLIYLPERICLRRSQTPDAARGRQRPGVGRRIGTVLFYRRKEFPTENNLAPRSARPSSKPVIKTPLLGLEGCQGHAARRRTRCVAARAGWRREIEYSGTGSRRIAAMR
jgi:hypothetical protein